MPDNELEFSVDSQLLGELGERLVTRNYIALAELIKNAYDADATQIKVRFVNAKKGGSAGQIQIIDNGHGMSFQEVRDHWMRIATTSKVRKPISPKYGRRKTGNKGVGRFACRRLAKKLVIESSAKIEGSTNLEWTQVTFNWDDFVPGTTLTEIPCSYEKKILKDGQTGLILKLTRLSESWTESEFNLLRRQVLGLSILKGVRREGFEEDPGFEIVLDAPEFPGGEGFLADQLMDAGWGKLEGEIDDQGICSLKLEAKEIGVRQYNLSERFDDLKGIKFEIAWLPMFKQYLRDTKIITKTSILDILEEQGGVRVFLDGFRVYPYGDPGNDWLHIDADVARRRGRTDDRLSDLAVQLSLEPTRTMLHHPRNQNLLGRVMISSHPETPLQVKLDREGFIQNKPYEDLVNVLRLSIQWMVLHYAVFTMIVEKKAIIEASKELEGYLADTEIPQTTSVYKTMPLAMKAIELISNEARSALKTLPEDQREKAEVRLESAKELVQRSFTFTETYSGILKAVASTGALMFNFSHEVKNLIGKLDTHANTLERIVNNIPTQEREEFISFAKSLRVTRDRLDQQIKLFGTLVRMSRETERRRILIKPICEEVIKGFQYLTEEYGINKPRIDVPDSLKAGPMLEVELFSIIVNLVSNAIKANLSGQGQNILIQAFYANEENHIRVYDDGIGIDEKYWEDVFRPLNADPSGSLYQGLKNRINDEALAALGRGSGIGLNIVKSTAEIYEGTAHFIKAESPWKTCVEVIIP
jgi:signal transduction histidine kinase